MNKPIKFAALGECMLELRSTSAHNFIMGFAGDTFNTALYLARYRHAVPVSVDYITALGDDPYSNMMLESWQQEGIGTHLVQQLKHHLPGAYFIRTDEQGERKFFYYRSQSAAKKLFYSPKIKSIARSLQQYNYLLCSAILLAILDNKSRTQLLKLLHQARQNGATICFDTNYRPILWENKAATKKWVSAALKLVDIALVTFADEQKLFGDKTPEACAKRLHKYGIKEVVVKLGERGCLVSMRSNPQQYVVGEAVVNVVDTTAAGDSFNAAYLAARMQGITTLAAAKLGNRLASTVIQYPGAIIPQEKMPKLF